MKKMLMSMLGATLIAFVSGGALAAGKDIDLGEQEYRNSCAVCHGQDGKAQTQIIDVLKVAPPSLNQISKRNGGVFPIARLYETIDGRLNIKSHGTREMPIWGKRYSAEAVPGYDDYPHNREVYVRTRIVSLIDYIYRMQDK